MSGQDILAIVDSIETHLRKFRDKNFNDLINKLQDEVTKLHPSWSGSNLGYHADVYYGDLQPRPPGAQFSQEWGLKRLVGGLGSHGDWREYSRADVKRVIYERAGNPDLSPAADAAKELREMVEHAISEANSIINVFISAKPDPFLKKRLEDLEATEFYSKSYLLQSAISKGQIMTRDSLATGQGLRAAPHQDIAADVQAIIAVEQVAANTCTILKQVGSHLVRVERQARKFETVGTNVFIGHGRAFAWRDLKDFVKDRLRLPYDEFNRVPVAGFTNIARLSEMLDAAAVAFIVLTAEDELKDGTEQARMNVIHEVGLFQGRLGFSKAIVLLEEGCAEFSNIQGLGQIRFPKGNMPAAFEEIRRVLEREGLIEEKIMRDL